MYYYYFLLRPGQNMLREILFSMFAIQYSMLFLSVLCLYI